MIQYDVVETPAGPVTAEVEGGKLLGLSFGEQPRNTSRRAKLPEVRRWLKDWFSGKPVMPPLRLEGTAFTKRVYEVVRRIPRGETRTYGEVADLAGKPGAARAVGNIMSKNQVCLFVPCHRVVASSGIGGWGGHGIEQKVQLLRREGVRKY